MNYLIARLQEPSTWAGVAALLAALHVSLPPGLWQNITTAGIAIGGILAAIMKELGS